MWEIPQSKTTSNMQWRLVTDLPNAESYRWLVHLLSQASFSLLVLWARPSPKSSMWWTPPTKLSTASQVNKLRCTWRKNSPEILVNRIIRCYFQVRFDHCVANQNLVLYNFVYWLREISPFQSVQSFQKDPSPHSIVVGLWLAQEDRLVGKGPSKLPQTGASTQLNDSRFGTAA